MIYFDGGGACWNEATCSRPSLAANPDGGFYKAELFPSDNPAALGGVFDLTDARNPVRDWSFIFVPYCTGDVHAGSASATYTDRATGEAFTIEHRGADNFQVVLEWARANFDAPQELLVAGSSAGAYGAAVHFARIRGAFPGGRATMLGDAGQGVTTSGFLARRNSNWGYDLPASVFGAQASLTADDDIVGRLAAHYSNDRFAQYTTAHDSTQTGFFALMGAHDACTAWTEAMSRGLTRRQHAPNFRSYLASGDSHTILRSSLFYDETSGGRLFTDWFAAMMSENRGDWQNQSCDTCLDTTAQCPF